MRIIIIIVKARTSVVVLLSYNRLELKDVTSWVVGGALKLYTVITLYIPLFEIFLILIIMSSVFQIKY